jgi:hypothetical protein
MIFFQIFCSAGDALREMYSHQLITDDFILINADVISNMKLGKIHYRFLFFLSNDDDDFEKKTKYCT